MALVPGQQLGGNRGALYTLRDAIIELQNGSAGGLAAALAGLSYSTTAVDTGRVAPGGAPIWRKTITIAAGPNANSVSIAHAITGLDAVYSIAGILSGGGSHFSLPVVDTATAANGVRLVVNATNVVLTSGADWSTLAGQVTIEYTVS